MNHKFDTPAAALEFVQGGNATVTIRSTVTGNHFTYKIRKSDDGSIFFVSVLRGQDNENDFTYIGTIRPGQSFRYGVKSKIGYEAHCVGAFGWAFAQIRQRDEFPPNLEVFHEGRCGRCNRKLTVPESIESGFGPECINLVNGEAA